MAEDTKVGGIVFDLSAPTDQIEKAGTTVPRVFASMENKVNNSLSSISTTVKATAAAFIAQFGARALLSTLDALLSKQKELKLASESLGISVRDLGAYQYALKSVGIEGEATTAILRTLYQRMSDREVTSEGVRIFSALGISVRGAGGNLKDFSAILPELANKFAGMRDGVEKSRLAVMLFGEKGLELLPLLNKGASGIEELTRKAEKLGLVYDNETNAAALRLNKSLNELRNSGVGFADSVFKDIIPSLQIYVDAMNSASESTKGYKDAVNIVSNGIKGFLAVLDGTLSTFISQGQLVIATVKAMGQAFTLDFAGATETFKKGFEDAAATMEGFTKRTLQSFGYVKEAGALFKDEFNKIAPPVVKTSEEISRAIQYAFQTIMQSNLMTPNEKMAQLKQMLDTGKIQWEQYATAVREISMKLEQEALARVIDLDTQPAINKLEALERARQKGVIGWHEYSMAIDRVNKQSAANMDDLVGAVGSSLTQIFKKSKAAAIASALINTYQGITKAIAQYPPPISYAMAGVQAALGFAQVAAIRSQNESGGGGGGATSAGAVAPAAASPSESSGPAMTQTLMVKGIDPRSLFTGEAVRSLADQLLQYQRDGGRVILT